MKRTILLLFLFALLGIVLVTFVLTPFTGDIYVFMGSAHQMEFFEGSFFERALHTWDVKGIFARTFMCVLYQAAVQFSDFASLKFEILVRAIYLLLSLIILFFSARLLCPQRNRSCRLFALLAIGLFATHYASHLQHEMTAVLIMLLSAALLISTEQTAFRRLAKDFLAGFLLGTLPYFKSIFIILPPVVLAAAILLQPTYVSIHDRAFWRRFAAISLGGLIMGLAGLTAIFLLYPEEIQDMLDVSAFQNTLFSGGFTGILSSIYLFCFGFLSNGLQMNPLIGIGALAALDGLNFNLKKGNLLSLACRLSLWSVPAGIILLSNCFFAYHYYLFAFPAIVECIDYIRRHAQSSPLIQISTALVLVASTVLYLGWMSIFSPNLKSYVLANKIQHQHHSSLLEEFPDLSAETFLYLDGGFGSYLTGGRSQMKYCYPLPLQRISESSRFHNLPCRLKCLDDSLHYTGKYIILEEAWLCQKEEYPELIEKIKREYDLVWGIHYMVNEWQVLSAPKITDRVSALYRRKAD